jgi:hypothetical protein
MLSDEHGIIVRPFWKGFGRDWEQQGEQAMMTGRTAFVVLSLSLWVVMFGPFVFFFLPGWASIGIAIIYLMLCAIWVGRAINEMRTHED